MILQNRALGLEIFQHGFSWVLTSGSAAAPRIEGYEVVQNGGEILKPTIKELNIVDPKQLGIAVRESYDRLQTGINRVSLSIPDSAGKVVMLEMDSPVKTKEEGVNQIKWKLKKNFPLDMNDVHLDFQELRKTESGVMLLVAMVNRKVVAEYEELLLGQGLEPAMIDFSIFNIYRLFAPRLEIEEDFAFLIAFRGSLAVLIFQDGTFDFYRCKQLSTAQNDPVRLFRELNSSLLVYGDGKGGWKPQKIFYISPSEERTMFRSIIVEATGVEPFLVDSDTLITASRQKIDRPALYALVAALGAATRGLG